MDKVIQYKVGDWVGEIRQTLGTCSLCGGPVSVKYGHAFDTAKCGTCGAVPKGHGPFILMQPASREENQ